MGLRIIDRIHNKEFVNKRLDQLRNLVEEHESRQSALKTSTDSKLVELLRKIESAKAAIGDTNTAKNKALEVEKSIKDSTGSVLGSLASLEPTKILDLL